MRVIARLDGRQGPGAEGREICIELIQEMREIRGVHGVHVMAYRQEETVAEIVERSRSARGRVPWYPGRDDDPPAHSKDRLHDRHRHQLRDQ